MVGYKTKVLLVNPPFYNSRFTGAPNPLLYAAASLIDGPRASEREVRLLDMSLPDRGWDALDWTLNNFKPSIVGITSTSPSHLAACGVAKMVKVFNPRVLTVKGGIHETYSAMTTQQNHPEIDISLTREGDITFDQVVERFASGTGIVRGVVIGEITDDLDKLPFAPRELLEDAPQYNFSVFNRRKTAQVMTTRGCQFTCTFCSSDANVRYARVRSRSVESVMAELEYLHAEGYRAIFFEDSTFTMNKKRVHELAARLDRARATRRVDLVWGCQTRADCIDLDVLIAMQRSGCTFITFGLETDAAQGLIAIDKGFQAHEVVRAIGLAKQAGIPQVGVSAIIGFPNETLDSVARTLEFIRNLEVRVSLSVMSLYPETQEGMKAGITGADYEQPTASEPIWSSFDEGGRAVHFIDADYATNAHQLAERILGSRLF